MVNIDGFINAVLKTSKSAKIIPAKSPLRSMRCSPMPMNIRSANATRRINKVFVI